MYFIPAVSAARTARSYQPGSGWAEEMAISSQAIQVNKHVLYKTAWILTGSSNSDRNHRGQLLARGSHPLALAHFLRKGCHLRYSTMDHMHNSRQGHQPINQKSKGWRWQHTLCKLNYVLNYTLHTLHTWSSTSCTAGTTFSPSTTNSLSRGERSARCITGGAEVESHITNTYIKQSILSFLLFSYTRGRIKVQKTR
jgi:hypothetical protein